MISILSPGAASDLLLKGGRDRFTTLLSLFYDYKLKLVLDSDASLLIHYSAEYQI